MSNRVHSVGSGKRLQASPHIEGEPTRAPGNAADGSEADHGFVLTDHEVGLKRHKKHHHRHGSPSNTPDIEILRRIRLFAGLDDFELTRLRRVMTEHHFKGGEEIKCDPAHNNCFNIITKGTVEFAGQVSTGSREVLGEATVGQHFGELAIVSGEASPIEARGKGEVTTLAMGRQDFMRYLETHPKAAVELMEALGRDVRQTDHLVRQIVSRDVTEIEDKKLTKGDRVVDKVLSIIGNAKFIIAQNLFIAGWMAYNVLFKGAAFDPAPFLGLNLVLAFNSQVFQPFLARAQSREKDIAGKAAQNSHHVAVKTELALEEFRQELRGIRRDLAEMRQMQLPPTASAQPAPMVH